MAAGRAARGVRSPASRTSARSSAAALRRVAFSGGVGARERADARAQRDVERQADDERAQLRRLAVARGHPCDDALRQLEGGRRPGRDEGGDPSVERGADHGIEAAGRGVLESDEEIGRGDQGEALGGARRHVAHVRPRVGAQRGEGRPDALAREGTLWPQHRDERPAGGGAERAPRVGALWRRPARDEGERHAREGQAGAERADTRVHVARERHGGERGVERGVGERQEERQRLPGGAAVDEVGDERARVPRGPPRRGPPGAPVAAPAGLRVHEPVKVPLLEEDDARPVEERAEDEAVRGRPREVVEVMLRLDRAAGRRADHLEVLHALEVRPQRAQPAGLGRRRPQGEPQNAPSVSASTTRSHEIAATRACPSSPIARSRRSSAA